MAVDVLSSGYKVDCRFYAGSDALGKLYWYECQPGAKPLPFPTAFCSSVWEMDPRTHDGPGEVNFGGKVWSPTLGPPLPGTHWHGDPSWFLHGIPADLPPDPTAKDCTAYAQRGQGGGAGGGAAPAFLLIGKGGGAGGGRGVGSPYIPRGGGAGGGVAPQSGPYFQLGRGGGAGGGVAPQTGPAVQVGLGGGAGGGETQQGEPGIITDCCGSTPIPTSTHFTFSGSPDGDCNVSIPVDWSEADEWWENPAFTIGTYAFYRLLIFCNAGSWTVQIYVSGFPVLTHVASSADCGPPHSIVFDVSWAWNGGGSPSCSGGGPTTGTWTP